MRRIMSKSKWQIGMVGLSLALGAIAVRPARAANDCFLAVNGDYATGGNWSGGVPGTADTAIINGARTANLSSAVSNITNLRLGDGSDGTLNFNTGASLASSADSFLGISASGTGIM